MKIILYLCFFKDSEVCFPLFLTPFIRPDSINSTNGHYIAIAECVFKFHQLQLHELWLFRIICCCSISSRITPPPKPDIILMQWCKSLAPSKFQKCISKYSAIVWKMNVDLLTLLMLGFKLSRFLNCFNIWRLVQREPWQNKQMLSSRDGLGGSLFF